MRITSGQAKGYKLKVPQGGEVRPAQNIVRQAIFNMIGEFIVGARVLDLFAGSGSLGIEALSRGAAWCDFVEKSKKVAQIINENLTKTRLNDKSKVYVMDAQRFMSLTRNKYNFIFLSPPYSQGIEQDLLKHLAGCVKRRGLVVFEHAKDSTMPQQMGELELIDQRSFGATTVSFLQKR